MLAIFALCSYFIGNVNFALIISKLKHKDIRKMGSGNPGTLNMSRNLGIKIGVLTLVLDVLKGALPALAGYLVFKKYFFEATSFCVADFALYLCGLCVIIGHIFPVFLGFHGGKGIACTGGLMVAVCPICVPICLTIFLATVLITKYVSLGSILVCISFFIQILVFGQNGMLGLSGGDLTEVYILAAVVMVLGIARHHANIGRLIHGTENKFYFKPKKQES